MPANSVVLDANLLVLLTVGTASKTYIARHKRLPAYTLRDYDLLLELLSSAKQVIVTPNTVTEASNLVRQIGGPPRAHIAEVFRRFLHTVQEKYVASQHAAASTAYVRLGIADAALLHNDFAEYVLLTADLDLYLEAARQGRQTIDFNHHIEADR